MKNGVFFHALAPRFLALSLLSALLLLGNAIMGNSQRISVAQAATLPVPNHVVVVIFENHSFSNIIGSSNAPYINSLARSGALFTHSFAIRHPSQPNYLALFSGSTQGITDDSCPHTFAGPDLGGELIAAHHTFVGFSEGLPGVGSKVCTSGKYARKHNPWVDFKDVPASDNRPFTSFPSPSNFSSLPTISFVVPNLLDDMHDGTVRQGDNWLKSHINPYVQWAKTHNSLLIVTWDEDDKSHNNQIPTIFVGPIVKAGRYSETINHYRVLRTLENMYGLPAAHNSAKVAAITDCWR